MVSRGFRHGNGFAVRRRPGMRQLRSHLHAAVAPRRHRSLSVQRVRAVPQDERHEPAFGEARQEIGRVRDGESIYYTLQYYHNMLLVHEGEESARFDKI